MKKFLVTAILGVSILATAVIPAYAGVIYYKPGTGVTAYPEADKWNGGLYGGTNSSGQSNGYFLAFSYYNNPKYYHRSFARIRDNSTLVGTGVGLPGQTVCANSKSVPYTDNVKVTAGRTDRFGNCSSYYSSFDGGPQTLTNSPY